MSKTNQTNVTKLLSRLLETKAETIKLGMDLHARDVVVCVQLDGALPQRPQKMTPADLLTLARGLVAAGRKVYSCYESGPCGYGLHRDLLAAGVTNYVVAAEVLGDARQQKTDNLDATALTDRLDRYVRGNTAAFTVNTVPTPEQEQARARGRVREQLKRSRHQWVARGKSLLLTQGFHITGDWWTERRWTELKPTLPAWLVTELEIMRGVLLPIDTAEKARRKTLEAAAPKNLPKAIGSLTWVLLALEICDWARFKNRRQVSSYTGLCPGVQQSGGSKRDGCINRYGNPRVRALLIELVWRLVRWQPDYPPVKGLVAGIARGAARRKCAVAAARKLGVDLWRLATKQTTPEKLKLIVPVELVAALDAKIKAQAA
ncbi:MAG: IS110 family transposase [Verrucomicrobia bacterium]|nr:IS110 family transposase [Verrucomicrobiota bacterium]